MEGDGGAEARPCLSSRSIGAASLFAIVAVCWLALSPPPAGAALRFASPTVISGGNAEDAEVAIDPQDRTTLAWSVYSGSDPTLQTVRLGADGSVGTVRTLSPHASEGQVGAGPDGRATIVATRWPHPVNGSSEVIARQVAPDGSLEAVQVLFSEPNWYGSEPQVAVDSLGRVTVVWRSTSGSSSRIQAVHIGADGTVGPVLNLSGSGAGVGGLGPHVAVAPDGRATVVWDGLGSSNGVRVVRLSAEGVPGEAQTLPGTGSSSLQPQLAVDSQGRATVVWRDGAEEDTRVDAMRIGADGTAGSVHTVSTEPVGILVHPLVATDPQDRAWVVWSRQEGAPEAFRWSIQAARIGADEALGPVKTLSGTNADHARIGIDSQGRAWLAWHVNESTYKALKVVRIGADGAPGPVETLTGPESNAYSPRVVIDSLDQPTVVWRRYAATNQIVAAKAQIVAPETTIDAAVWEPIPSFDFSSPDLGVQGFGCSLDGSAFAPCESPKTFPALSVGSHVFEVRAEDEESGADATPAASSFTVQAPPVEEPRQAPSEPPPASPPKPQLSGIAKASPVAVVKAGVAMLRLRCRGDGPCRGMAVLVMAKGSEQGAGRPVAGRRAFQLLPGETKLLPVSLSRECRGLVRRRPAAGLKVQLKGTGLERGPLKLLGEAQS